MCGIFALLLNSKVDKSILNKYIEYGAKRGPESSKIEFYNDDKICFGFHRLAINGLDQISNQPIQTQEIKLICNGEIYNHKELTKNFNLVTKTNSDCEAILQGFSLVGSHIFNMLDGVFACVIYDQKNNRIIVARDPYGVRPLYVCEYQNGNIGFCSDLKPLLFDEIVNIKQFIPGTYCIYEERQGKYEITRHEIYFNNMSLIQHSDKPIEYYMYNLVEKLKAAIFKRVDVCQREIACLLSGGLDSSLISAYVSRFYKMKCGKNIETYSIGLANGEDLYYSEMVANHIKSIHKTVIVSNEEMIESIPNVIKDIESYDTTTVRASAGNWNIGKYIKNNSLAKVIFNGDGADELMGGYMYFHVCPDDQAFHNQKLRLLSHISHFDVLRSDKSISSHGLQARTPYLDREFTKYYLSIPIKYRNHNNDQKCEKYFIRKAIELYDPQILPSQVLWRKKQAFSDGISSVKKSWFEIIQESIKEDTIENYETNHNRPQTKEQSYYRKIFCDNYQNCDNLLPYFWMPKFVKDATDASARTLQIYKKKEEVKQ